MRRATLSLPILVLFVLAGTPTAEATEPVASTTTLTEAHSMTDEPRDVPDWARDAVWYQIFPERFRNGDPTNDPRPEDIGSEASAGWTVTPWGQDWYARSAWEESAPSVFHTIWRRRYGGDLQGILDKLDYLEDLGINALYLNPIFRAPSHHKYDGSCFHHVEETFGPDPEGDRRLIAAANETEDPATWVWTSADRLFLKLLRECHRRGIRVIIDGVFNHSGRDFFAFQDLRQHGQASRYASWYSIDRWDPSLPDGFSYRGWFGISTLPEFRRAGDEVDASYKEYVWNVTRRWMAPDGKIEDGIDGWRLDVAFCLPHRFWKEWRQHVKSINPDAYITGEVVEIAPDYLRGDEFDALMNYPFAYAATEFFIDKANRITASEFDRRLQTLRDAYPSAITNVMQNLYSSHDCARLQTLIVNPDMNFRDWGPHFNRSKVEHNRAYRIDRGDWTDAVTHRLMVTFQMTYLGAPMVYYGNEAGMTGANDPCDRKPMLWDDLAYQDEAVDPHGRPRPVEPNVADRITRDHYRRMIHLRRHLPSLSRGSYRTVLVDDERQILAFERRHLGQRAVVIINAGDADAIVRLPRAAVGLGPWRGVYPFPGTPREEAGEVVVRALARDAVILVLDGPVDR